MCVCVFITAGPSTKLFRGRRRQEEVEVVEEKVKGAPLTFFSPSLRLSVPQEKSIRKFSQGKLMVTRRPTVYLLPEAELARGLNVGLEAHSRWSLLREF